jgi:hypothetical protein
MAGLILIAVALTMGACSEEQYGSLYCPGPVDTLVVYPSPEIHQLTVIGDESGMSGMESLYLGSSGATRSDILLEYDFGSILGNYPEYPDSLFELANIRSVRLVMHRLRPFPEVTDSLSGPGIIYHVQLLDNGFSTEDYIVPPGPAPSLTGRILNQDFSEPNYFDEPYLRLYKDDVADWIRNGDKVSMVVTAAAGSDTGLVGYASLELDTYSLLPPLGVGSIPAPSIWIRFYDHDSHFGLPPINDTSTFDQVATLPAGFGNLQTGIRSYPVFTFEIPPLPEGSCATVGMGIKVNSQMMDPMWEESFLFLSHVEAMAFEAMDNPVLAETLQDALQRQFGGFPDSTGNDGTTYFQSSDWRPYPQYPPGIMNLMLNYPDRSLGQYGFSFGHPDIYFSQSSFFGPGAAPEFRPTLLIIHGQAGG